jgi:hypothetical protein
MERNEIKAQQDSKLDSQKQELINKLFTKTYHQTTKHSQISNY